MTILSMLILLAAGCVQERVDLKHVSQIGFRTKGVSFVDDGKSVDSGMAGNTCRFDVDMGVITLDTDVAQGEEDSVTDSFNGNTVVVSRSGGFVITQDYSNPDLIHIFPGRNVTDARLTQESALALINENNECQIGWYSSTSETTHGVDECPSANQIDLQRETNTAFFVSGEGIMTFTPLGVEYFAPRADALKWDSVTQALYTSTDGRVLTAHNLDGSVRWVAELSGRITSFDDMGTAEAIIIMVETDDAHGELVILDAHTGQIKKTFETPTAARDVIVSQDGRTLAAVLDNETHFFSVNTDL